MVIMIVGKPGAGKTHHAYALAKEYSLRGEPAAVLDGDEVRAETDNRDFTDTGRRQHLVKIANMAAKFERHGIVAVVAVVAPKKEYRDMMRGHWQKSRMIYLPGGSLWEGTEYEAPRDAEF